MERLAPMRHVLGYVRTLSNKARDSREARRMIKNTCWACFCPYFMCFSHSLTLLEV